MSDKSDTEAAKRAKTLTSEFDCPTRQDTPNQLLFLEIIFNYIDDNLTTQPNKTRQIDYYLM